MPRVQNDGQGRYWALATPSATSAAAAPNPLFAQTDIYAFLRRDLAKVSNATASTMITPMMICWM